MKSETEHNTTIPAAPGWFYCCPMLDGDTVCDIAEMPVIAWIITYRVDHRHGEVVSRFADAVVADEGIGYPEKEYLKRPDGWYVVLGDGWRTRDDLIAEMQRERNGGQQ